MPKYESLDFDQNLLQKVYELADDKLRKRIADKARQAGRVAWVQIVAGGLKGQRLGEMTDAEWETTLNVLSNGKQWEEMWRLAQKAPAIWSKQLLQKLKQIRWLPKAEQEQVGFKKLKRLSNKCLDDILPMAGLTTRQAHLTVNICEAFGINFSPDGKILASWGRRKIRLWRMPDGQPLATLTGSTFASCGMSLSPDGKILASWGVDVEPETIWLRQMPDGKHLATLTGHTDEIKYIRFSPDGKILASCSPRTIRLWRMPDGKPLATLTVNTCEAFGLNFSPDGKIFASLGVDVEVKTIKLWRMPDGQPLATLTGHTDSVSYISFSPDGKILASCCCETIRLWRMPDGQPLATLTGHTGSVLCMNFSPDGKILASRSGGEKTIRLWQMPDGQPLATLTGHTGSFTDINFSPDGKILASCSRYDETIRLWRMPDGQHLTTLRGGRVLDISFSPDGKILASRSDKTIKLWSSDLPRLINLPIKKLNQQDRESIERALQNKKGTEEERHWLEFMQALMDWHRRFDVEVEDAPQLVSTGEFDIEIEG